MKLRPSFLLLALLSLVSTWAWAVLPITERIPTASDSAPLDLLSSQPEKIFIPTFGDFKDQYLFSWEGSSLTIIDLETFSLYATQPDDFSSSIADVALLPDGESLIIALSSGDLVRIELDDETTFVDEDDDTDDDDETTSEDSREINLSTGMTSAGISTVVTNPASTAEVIYMINEDDQYYYEYNITTNDLIEVSLASTSSDDDTTTSYVPKDIVYANGTSLERVLVTTSEGALLAFTPETGSYSAVQLSARDTDESESVPALSQIAMTSDGNYAFVIDTANDFVWVYSLSDGAFADQLSGETSLDPIIFDTADENSELDDILIFHDEDDDEDFAYVSGSLGLSILDASDPESKTSTSKIVDQDTSTSDVYDPLELSGTPGPLAASSEDDGYIYSVNGDALISVISENPFVTISAASASSLTETSSTFTLTFQSDETGTYTVRANSDPTATTGTEIISSTTLSDANTDITTSSIDINLYDRSVFEEGSNKIFIFVTDSDGNIGRDAALITVDRPPEAITINGVDFGNRKAYVDFTPSEDNDIASYQIYAEPAESQSAPDCPGSLDFSSPDVTESIDPDDCGTSSCEAVIDELTNDTVYCIAIKAIDEAGQEGSLSSFATPVMPEATLGPAAFLGETGCSLGDTQTSDDESPPWSIIIIFSIFLLWQILKSLAKHAMFFFTVFVIIVIGIFLFLSSSQAMAQAPNSEHFTLELKSALWIPTNSDVKQFFGACCNPVGEIEFGYIHKNRYNATVTAGFAYFTGNAVSSSGLASGDDFTLMTFPIRVDFIYRFDYVSNQIVVPYLRAGFDSVIFRESTEGDSLSGNKFGLHGGAGFSVLLDNLDSTSLEQEGVNDVYLTFEGRYAHINSFKSTGLDLSGFYPYVGILFQF